jgi:integrase/recombinase XerD
MNAIGDILHSFLLDYLPVQRGFLPSSVKSYRDALRLYLQFASKKSKCRITKLELSHFNAESITEFLKWLEVDRHNSIRTRNHRLAVLHSFCEYIASRVPEYVVDAQRIATIQEKRCHPPETFFLELDEVNQMFKCALSNSRGRLGIRDKALLLFLYNTGARVQEVASLRIEQLELDARRVHLHGKGGKWRSCPLWKETVENLRNMLVGRSLAPQDPVFLSNVGKPITRFGIYKLVRRHTSMIKKRRTNGSWKTISPHTIRHTTAIHLLESGVEVNVIRGWLGHVSLDTTNRYAEISMRMKEEAMKACQPPIPIEKAHVDIRWRDDASLLKWLDSL